MSLLLNEFNTLRPRENGRHFADDIFKCIFVNENLWIRIKISLKFVPRGPFNNTPALVQIMAWRRPGDKPLSEPMMVRLPTHIWVTRPQWVKGTCYCHATILMKYKNIIKFYPVDKQKPVPCIVISLKCPSKHGLKIVALLNRLQV